MEQSPLRGCTSGRAITRADIPAHISVDDDGTIWTTHNLGGAPGLKRKIKGTLSQRGYLTVRINGKIVPAHRIVYAWHYGHAPSGKLIRHLNHKRTDNRPINLAVGSAQDNSDDSSGRYTGDHARGEKNVNAKMTAEKVREIRDAHTAGEKQVPLARRYGLSQASLWAIIHRKTWKHVD